MSQTAESPVILSVEPSFALPGGEIVLHGRALLSSVTDTTQVSFGESIGTVVFGSPTKLTVSVPENATGDSLTVTTPNGSTTVAFTLATLLSENLHPVANPAVDHASNIYVTFSGSRGQTVPTSLFRIDDESTLHPIAAEVMNPTGLALDDAGNLYISSRHDGAVYRLSVSGDLSTYAEGMGVATGLAFDELGYLYVGDRSGTIFKIAPDRQIFVFATLEPSVAAYHLAFSPSGNLYVTGPTTSSNDCVYEIDPHGVVTPFFANLGRPQGLAFDLEGNLLVAASWRGRRGIVRISPDKQASLVIGGSNLVGLAFDASRALILATNSAAFFLPWNTPGFLFTPELPQP
jgi:DNA-binding beta-propeller fold protein YncE